MQPHPSCVFSVRLMVLIVGFYSCVHAQERPSPVPSSIEKPSSPINLPAPTMGGTQFWSDELVHGKWRIQRNVLTNHYRLLNDHDIRRAWGSYQNCHAEFDRLRRENRIRPLGKEVVICLHGLGGYRGLLDEIVRSLETSGDFTVINVTYASTRGNLSEHASSLEKVIANLDGVEKVHFVAHSMGNLVVRQYFTNLERNPNRIARVPEFGRFVMLGPPNQGAEFADRLGGVKGVSKILGPSVVDLVEIRNGTKSLVAPRCEFGIIAGKKQDKHGSSRSNPLIEGDDDLMVSVEETQLSGAHDYLVVPVGHHYLLSDPTVLMSVNCFLKHGYFISERQRLPLP